MDLNALYPRDSVDTYFIDGERYTHNEALHDYQQCVYDPLNDAVKAAGNVMTFDRHT